MGRAGGYARRRTFFRPLDGAAVHRRRHRQADSRAARRIRRRAPCRRGSGGRRGLPAATRPTSCSAPWRRSRSRPFPTRRASGCSVLFWRRARRRIPSAASWNVPPSGCLPVSASPMFDGIENRLAVGAVRHPRRQGRGVRRGLRRFAPARKSKTTTPSVWRTAASSRRRTAPAASSAASPPVCRSSLRVGIKPTPSIGRPQKTVSLARMENTELTIRGRHDPCIAHRAVPVVEAVTACVLLDLLLEEHHGTF